LYKIEDTAIRPPKIFLLITPRRALRFSHPTIGFCAPSTPNFTGTYSSTMFVSTSTVRTTVLPSQNKTTVGTGCRCKNNSKAVHFNYYKLYLPI